MPDFSNELTRETEIKMGPFVCEPHSYENLEMKGPYEIDEGAIYLGECNSKGQRMGHGTQIWIDGSKYHGNWINN